MSAVSVDSRMYFWTRAYTKNEQDNNMSISVSICNHMQA